jgi:hypothetical protein
MPHARCFTRWTGAVFACATLMHHTASAQVIERELGDFSLKLGTTPSRTMAQGSEWWRFEIPWRARPHSRERFLFRPMVTQHRAGA